MPFGGSESESSKTSVRTDWEHRRSISTHCYTPHKWTIIIAIYKHPTNIDFTGFYESHGDFAPLKRSTKLHWTCTPYFEAKWKFLHAIRHRVAIQFTIHSTTQVSAAPYKSKSCRKMRKWQIQFSRFVGFVIWTRHRLDKIKRCSMDESQERMIKLGAHTH